MGRAGSSREQCTSQQAAQHDMVSSHPLHPVNAMVLGAKSLAGQLKCQHNSQWIHVTVVAGMQLFAALWPFQCCSHSGVLSELITFEAARTRCSWLTSHQGRHWLQLPCAKS